jgi:hypothetical protein
MARPEKAARAKKRRVGVLMAAFLSERRGKVKRAQGLRINGVMEWWSDGVVE